MLKNSNNYEFVPPDGGWGYVIALAFSICIVSNSDQFVAYEK